MKIAVTAKGRTIESEVAPRFGRAPFFLIVDTESFDVEVVDNSENLNAFKGAGIQAATDVSTKSAEVLLTGFCGPNAFKTLNTAGIKVATDAKGTVKNAVEAFNNGVFSFANGANTEGYW